MRRLPKAVIASRANGARSRGPKTLEAKRRCSLNALRHGLLAKNVVLKNESEEVFSALLAQHIHKLDPADDVELSAVEDMTASLWRLRRMWAIEKNLFDKGISKRSEAGEAERIAGAYSDLSAGPELHLLDRYESRLHRMYQRSLHNFMILRELNPPDSDPKLTRKSLPGTSETENYQTDLFPCNPLAA